MSGRNCARLAERDAEACKRQKQETRGKATECCHRTPHDHAGNKHETGRSAVRRAGKRQRQERVADSEGKSRQHPDLRIAEREIILDRLCHDERKHPINLGDKADKEKCYEDYRFTPLPCTFTDFILNQCNRIICVIY